MNHLNDLDDIRDFFQNPPPVYLSPEQGACYVLDLLLTEGESYGVQIACRIRQDFPHLRLSDAVLYSVLNFLENQRAIVGYSQKTHSKGRPRRVYCIRPESRQQAEELARLWREFLDRHHVLCQSAQRRSWGSSATAERRTRN